MPDPYDVHLFIPGPAGAAPEVLEETARPIVPHYGADFVAAYNECRDRLKQVFRTGNDLFIIVGPGTAALDSAMASALPDGARVLVPHNGWFGARTAEMCRAHRARVEEMAFPIGEVIDAGRVVERLRGEPRVDAVAWVHHETSTGVLNPVEPISRAARELGILSVIDAVSSLGGAPLEVDDWDVDLCVSVSNKAIASHPGLSAITVSEPAWAAIDANPDTRSWYLDLRTWRRYDREWAAWHPYPTTVSSGQIAALSVALERILAEGLDAHVARTRRAAARVRSGLRGMGFEMFVPDEYASPLTTAVKAHPEIPAAELISQLRERHRIYISGGLADLAGKIFRVGHMGSAIEDAEVDLLLAAFEDVLRLRGLGLEKESAGVEGA